MDNEKREMNEQEWAAIIESSRKGNNKMMNLFSLNRSHVESFTERFRKEGEASIVELSRMQSELQVAVEEVWEAKRRAFQELPSQPVPCLPVRHRRTLHRRQGEGKATRYLISDQYAKKASLTWHYLYLRESNMQYIRQDIETLFKDTKDLLAGMMSLTEVVDQMAAEGLGANQLIWFENEFKNHTRHINDIYRQINMAAFHLHGTLAKEKEIIVRSMQQRESAIEALRQHQAVQWAYNQYFQYRMTGNQYLTAALQALDALVQVVRKEVMRRKVESLHRNAKAASIERMEIARKQREAELARQELGDSDWEDDGQDSDHVEQTANGGTTFGVQSQIDLASIPVPEKAVVKEEVPDEEESIGGTDEEEKRSIFPLVILVLILIGVGLYYFKDKWM